MRVKDGRQEKSMGVCKEDGVWEELKEEENGSGGGEWKGREREYSEEEGEREEIGREERREENDREGKRAEG